MILVGGWCLWVDSIINIYINTSIYPKDLALRYEYVCISSIATTFIFNQVGYLCIIFRALRIFKIMVLEKQYLDQIYLLQQQAHGSSSLRIQEQKDSEDNEDSSDQEQSHSIDIQKLEHKMVKLQEKKDRDLAKLDEVKYLKLMTKFIVFFSAIGILGYFLYPLFIFVPIYQSSSCFKLRYGLESFNNWEDNNHVLHKGLLTAQSTFFILFNWMEIVLINKVYSRLKNIE